MVDLKLENRSEDECISRGKYVIPPEGLSLTATATATATAER